MKISVNLSDAEAEALRQLAARSLEMGADFSQSNPSAIIKLALVSLWQREFQPDQKEAESKVGDDRN